MDKEIIHIHTYPHEKELNSDIATLWMDLVQDIMLSETSPRKTTAMHDHLYVTSTYPPSTCM